MLDLIHGAKWWKFDFHNHTPASFDFGKDDPDHKSITPENWLLMYMAEGIDCVAITDHNSGKWIDLLKNALTGMENANPKPDGYRKLHLFPGVEITANGNIHILALFDISADTTNINALLGAVGLSADSFGTSNSVTTMSVESVINEIHKAGGIAIPAHVDQASGLFKSQQGHTLEQTLAVEGLLAIELVDNAYIKPDVYRQSKLQLAEVIGTDSHIKEQVGTNFTWVKMGNPSLDALKLALHDREDGIIRKDEINYDPNLVSNRYFIKSLSVSKGFKAGNRTPLKTEFSPWLNSVIGGRGSGKSSLLNYLRIALSRTDEMPKEVQLEFDKFKQVGSKNGTGMLRNDTSIEVEIFKDGKLYLITWNSASFLLKEYDYAHGNWKILDKVSNIKELFPIQIFNQKELYALTRDPSKLIELIDSQFDKSEWESTKETLLNQWISERAKRRQLISAISEEANIKAQLRSINNKISLFESSEYREILNNFNKLSEVNRFIAETNLTFSNFVSKLREFEHTIPKITIPDVISETIDDNSLNFIIEMSSALNNVKTKISDTFDLLAPYTENLKAQLKRLPWFEQFEAAKQAYTDIEASMEELGTESYEDLLQRRSSLTEKLDSISFQIIELVSLNNKLDRLYTNIIENEKELRVKRKDIISRWEAFEDEHNPFLIIELLPMSNVENAESSFRELLRKSSGEFSNDIYTVDEDNNISKGIIARIINEDEASRWDKRKIEIESFISATETDKKNLDLRLAKHLDSLKQNTPEDIDRLLVWVPEDKLDLKFRKQGKLEDIQSGSAGERTAGMLGLLLALNDIPLIIDQPEDDLDTKLISNFVVEGFKKLKKKRQLVIVTHNPNIAVNANSDNVIYMNFVNGQIVNAGNNALQDKTIRNAVCEVMEGGRDALNKRYYRISKALKS